MVVRTPFDRISILWMPAAYPCAPSFRPLTFLISLLTVFVFCCLLSMYLPEKFARPDFTISPYISAVTVR